MPRNSAVFVPRTGGPPWGWFLLPTGGKGRPAALRRRDDERPVLPRLQQRHADDQRERTATYTFTAATIAAAGNQVAFPTGTITAIDVLIENFTNPAFKNQGDCVRFVATGGKNPPNG